MTASPETLEKIAGIIRSEAPKYLPAEFVIHDVTAENRPGPDEEDWVDIRVILEDDHPKLDMQVHMWFRREMGDLFEKLGIPHDPNMSYTDRSERNA